MSCFFDLIFVRFVIGKQFVNLELMLVQFIIKQCAERRISHLTAAVYTNDLS